MDHFTNPRHHHIQDFPIAQDPGSDSSNILVKYVRSLWPFPCFDLSLNAPSDHPSKKRIGENVKIRYPKDYIVKSVSSGGFFSFEGKSYHVGEHFVGCQMGLHDAGKGRIQLHYANLLLGTLKYDSEGRFRPTAYIAPHYPNALDTLDSKWN